MKLELKKTNFFKKTFYLFFSFKKILKIFIYPVLSMREIKSGNVHSSIQ